MEKEIKVRKKRFAAFWTAVLMVCGMAMPMVINADALAVEELSAGNLLNKGELLSYSYKPADGATSQYEVYYLDYDGTLLYSEPDVANNTENYVVEDYPKQLSDGAAFKGWTVNKVDGSGGEMYSVTLRATVAFNITYVPSDAQGNNPDTYTYGSDITISEPPMKAGYTFGGWFSDENHNNSFPGINESDAEPITVYAKFEPNSYNISYEPADSQGSNPLEYTYGTSVTLSDPPEKTDYTFSGWYMEQDFSGDAVTTIGEGEPGNITLYAKFTRSITYVLNGGTNADSNPASYVEGIGANLAAASRPGFVFAGWYTDKEFTTKIESIGTDVIGNLELYAKFDIGAIGPYTYDLKKGVQYQLGSATKVSGDNSTYVSGSTFYVPEDGSYTFS